MGFNARQSVDKLHEDAFTPRPRALFFVPGLTYSGLLVVHEDPFADFITQISRIHPQLKPSLQGDPAVAVNFLIEHHNLMAVVRYEEEVSVYCRKKRNKVPTTALTALSTHLQVYGSTRLGWFASLDSDPQETFGHTTFYGEADRLKAKKPKRTPPSDAYESIVDKLLGGLE